MNRFSRKAYLKNLNKGQHLLVPFRSSTFHFSSGEYLRTVNSSHEIEITGSYVTLKPICVQENPK